DKMKAMILAAGLGTRLRPVTEHIPKALVMVNGMTLLEHAVTHLKQYGIDQVIINVHHFADQVIEFVIKKKSFGIQISFSDEREALLETGGGLKKAAWFFNDGQPFLVRNVDVISDLDLKSLLNYHLASGSMATLVVRSRETSRYFLFDKDNRLRGWTNLKTGEKKWVAGPDPQSKLLAFSGIQILDPAVFPLITETGSFSVTDLYLRLAVTQKITGYMDEHSQWKDIGKSPDDLKTTNG
ncbi:MAG TPA: nucleotidyltransferase family protein, partial [Bacteroidales bacterium]|nr:nucleotidyltransferase family protein [Bacteroidales bacterium]